MSLKERKKKCPRCGAVITFYPAISRKDNKTEICSDCGVIEAIEEYINFWYLVIFLFLISLSHISHL